MFTISLGEVNPDSRRVLFFSSEVVLNERMLRINGLKKKKKVLSKELRKIERTWLHERGQDVGRLDSGGCGKLGDNLGTVTELDA